MAGALDGLRVVELAGLGPAPFCGMMLADMGADIVRVERPGAALQRKPTDVLARGRRVVEVDLKSPEGVDALRALIKEADVLIEGFRPGVMERLGLGPEPCLSINRRLVFARMTGWGQTGPLAPRAGHDMNYIAISGALYAIGPADGPPAVPLNLVGDFGGGGMMLAMGILAGVISARQTGRGQVIDAAMTDGAALLTAMMWGFMGASQWVNERGANFLDGAAHFYTIYECADGKHLAVGAIEPQFYATLLEGCGLSAADLPGDYRDRANWQASKAILTPIFKRKTRDEWCEVFDGKDACVAPVLDWQEALQHEHNIERGTFMELQGVIQPAPAPRFSGTPSKAQASVVESEGIAGVLSRWAS